MTAVETVCRAFALAACEDGSWSAAREKSYVDQNWRRFEDQAKRLIRSLKGQPPHVTDCGATADFSNGCGPVLDAMLEAMAR